MKATNQNFHKVALSVPMINKNKSGFKTSIVSSISTESFKIYKLEFLKRINDLGLKNMAIVFVSDKTVNPLFLSLVFF